MNRPTARDVLGASASFDRRTFLASSATVGAFLLGAGEATAKSSTPVTVKERIFSIDGGREPIPCALWMPDGAEGPRPLVLMGHGGGGSKKSEKLVALAERFVRRGYAVAAIDQPNHGERASEEFLPENIAETRRRLGLAEMTRRTHAATPQSVEDWGITLNYLQQLPEIGAGGPVAYYGVSLGTRYGVPFVAAEKRISAAIFGLFGFNDTLDPEAMKAAALRIEVPLLYFHQWNDQFVKLEGVLAMYEAFASKEKSLHINPGRHTEMPLFEQDAMERFLARLLG